MKKYACTLLLSFLYVSYLFGQKSQSTCSCPQTNLTDSIVKESYHFSNGKTIVLCGFQNTDDKQISYSEFVLSVCTSDTIIDFWGAIITCRLSMLNDTLIIEDLHLLPTGKKFKFEETVWTIEKVFFQGENLVRKREVNQQIQHFSKQEIETVLKQYKSVQSELIDQKMKYAYQLFMAAISGNQTARNYFIDFPNMCDVLDGAYKEEYNELKSMLQLWDERNLQIQKQNGTKN